MVDEGLYWWERRMLGAASDAEDPNMVTTPASLHGRVLRGRRYHAHSHHSALRCAYASFGSSAVIRNVCIT